jgi:hypothetical protein
MQFFSTTRRFRSYNSRLRNATAAATSASRSSPVSRSIAVADRHLGHGPVRAAVPGVLGVRVHDPVLERREVRDRVQAVHQHVGRIIVDTEPAGIQPVEKCFERLAGFQARFQRERCPDPVAVLAQRSQAFGHDRGREIGRVVGNAARLHDRDPRPQLEAQCHDLPDAVDPLLEVGRIVESVSQRAAQRGQLEAVGAEQVLEFAAAGVGEPVGHQFAGRVHLEPGQPEPAGLREPAAERQAERFQRNAEFHE